jgi:hypothetical protein
MKLPRGDACASYRIERKTIYDKTVAFYYAFAPCCIGETYGSHKDGASKGNHEA